MGMDVLILHTVVAEAGSRGNRLWRSSPTVRTPG
jgi:hypothetical protein